jgi:hypothetical protein
LREGHGCAPEIPTDDPIAVEVPVIEQMLLIATEMLRVLLWGKEGE